MKTYLLTWIPKYHAWQELPQMAEGVKNEEDIRKRWSCQNEDAAIGDRVFLLKQGDGTRGVFASGTVREIVGLAPHFDPEKACQGKMKHYVIVQFDALLQPEVEPILPYLVVQRLFAKEATAFLRRQSGTEIKSKLAAQLDSVWKSHLQCVELDFELAAFEGAQRHLFVIHRQRERALRELKIAQVKQAEGGRLPCAVRNCNFDFQSAYGRLGKDYAQVHHLKPLSKLKGPQQMTLDDLIVVCANCHAMIHRNGECRNPKSLIKRRAK